MNGRRVPYNSVQKAVYGRLQPDLAALSPSVPIFSPIAPAGQAFPFAVLSQFSASPDLPKGVSAQRVVLTIDAWSQKESSIEINTILDTALESLSRSELVLEGGFRETFGIGREELVEVFAEQDATGVLLHGVIRYSLTVQDTDYSGN